MKRRLTRNAILMAIVTLIMGIGLSLYIASTGTVPAADNAASYTDGTYTASAHGCLSDVAVTVTITGGKVTDVDIDASGETPELGGNAAAALAEQLTEAGTTTGVDAVAGATMTSDAVFTAMDDCLSQAQ
ncbi:FMN-binding protein [Faecalibacterium langellae]|uniref:FMN-binding protein n=1 Tax=Faecalibacterium langellae TaxID=3435293 RepID=A0ACC9CZC1_9FIRM|nr:FMN-binding protein [Faecalibacterium prausnitzii]PDX61028.1 FMN-binding protein [Faecalibacterium prausnitzii]